MIVKTKPKRMLRHVVGAAVAAIAVMAAVFSVLAFKTITAHRSPDVSSALLALHNSDSAGSAAISMDTDGRPTTPAYTILQQQVVYDTNAILYLYTWEYRGETCLAIREVREAQDVFGGWFAFTLSRHCDDSRQYALYTDQLGWKPGLFVVYGISDDAKLVDIQWQDGAASAVRAINSSYMLLTRRENAEVARADFVDSNGAILHSLIAENLRK